MPDLRESSSDEDKEEEDDEAQQRPKKKWAATEQRAIGTDRGRRPITMMEEDRAGPDPIHSDFCSLSRGSHIII